MRLKEVRKAALFVIIVAFAMIYEIGSAIIPAAYNHPILTIIIIDRKSVV